MRRRSSEPSDRHRTRQAWLSTVGAGDPARPETLAERVYKRLSASIAAGEIPIGTRLPAEHKLAEAFDVSRPVVRQALDRLRGDGVTESRRGSGTFVIDRRGREKGSPAAETVPLEDVSEFLAELEFRIVVESETAYFASLRRGPEDLNEMLRLLDEFERALSSGAEVRKYDYLFHRTIARATGNSQFVKALEQVNQSSSSATAVARHRLHFRPLERGLAVLHEHRDIYELIKAQDAEAARRAMKNHLERARIRILGTAPI